METTAVRKLLIDSRFRNADSVSSTDFQFELNRSITLPRKCVAFVTDIHLPHSWYNVDDHAHRLFWMERFFDAQHTTIPALRVHKAELTQQHYDGTTLAQEITDKMNAAKSLPNHTYLASYNGNSGRLSVALQRPLGSDYLEVDLAPFSPTTWFVYSDQSNTTVGTKLLTKTSATTYTYVQDDGVTVTLTVSGLFKHPTDPTQNTFRVDSTKNNDFFNWHAATGQLRLGSTGVWNWRPQGFSPSVEPIGNFFCVLTDAQLALDEWYDRFAFPSVINGNVALSYDKRSPASINHLLRHDGITRPTQMSALDSAPIAGGANPVTRHDETGAAYGPWVTGVLDLSGMGLPLHIVSPNMTNFGTSMGPRGEHTIMRKVSPDSDHGGFGGHIVDTLQNEQDYFICGSLTLKTLSIQLVSSEGRVMDLNGANWSFSIIFQDLAA